MGTRSKLLADMPDGTQSWNAGVDFPGIALRSNGHDAGIAWKMKHVEMTLSTTAVTTDQSEWLPANSQYLAVTSYVTEAAPSITNYQLGDSSDPNRFGGTSTGITLGSQRNITFGAFNGANYQGSTTITLRIVCGTTAGGAGGKIRVSLAYMESRGLQS